jgi:hypothetical protein
MGTPMEGNPTYEELTTGRVSTTVPKRYAVFHDLTTRLESG